MEIKEVYIHDIETLIEFTLLGFKNIRTGEIFEFHINRWENDLYKFIKFVDSLKENEWVVGFYSLTFDAQVVEFIIREHEKWLDLSNLEITEIIWQKAQDIIDDIKHELYPPYREESLSMNTLDLFKVHHYDNAAKRSSLKWLEFSMDMADIEEMPIKHNQRGLSKLDLIMVSDYWRNDIKATEAFYNITIGNTDNEIYKDDNKIQDRIDLINSGTLPKIAINYSDVKIGSELNLVGYMVATGLTRKEVYELKKNRKSTKGFTFGECIPKYVKFQTKEFKDLYNRVKGVRVNLTSDKQEFPFIYKGTTYTIARGGLHSVDKKRTIIPKPDEILKDADIGSQYPVAIWKRKLFPSHLGPKWLIMFAENIFKRISDKKKSKEKGISPEEKRRLEGSAKSKKLQLNGGGFGMTNETHNWQFDPRVTYNCTIGNEFEILMLIETLELGGIHCISANTDGIVCLYPRDLDGEYNRICKEWEKIVGNDGEVGQLEYKEYKAMYQLSVSSYLSIDMEGKVKKKKEFLTDHELHTNKSRRIVPLALEEYYTKGTDVRKFITDHKNIFDFCIGVKASKDYHYELINRKGEKRVYDRIVRYIVTTNGDKLMKIKNPACETNGPEVSQCEADDKVDGRSWKCTVVNTINKKRLIECYNIDYEYYIRKAEMIIKQVEGVSKKTIVNKNQLNLF